MRTERSVRSPVKRMKCCAVPYVWLRRCELHRAPLEGSNLFHCRNVPFPAAPGGLRSGSQPLRNEMSAAGHVCLGQPSRREWHQRGKKERLATPGRTAGNGTPGGLARCNHRFIALGPGHRVALPRRFAGRSEGYRVERIYYAPFFFKVRDFPPWGDASGKEVGSRVVFFLND